LLYLRVCVYVFVRVIICMNPRLSFFLFLLRLFVNAFFFSHKCKLCNGYVSIIIIADEMLDFWSLLKRIYSKDDFNVYRAQVYVMHKYLSWNLKLMSKILIYLSNLLANDFQFKKFSKQPISKWENCATSIKWNWRRGK
jgi:hypothetical protein